MILQWATDMKYGDRLSSSEVQYATMEKLIPEMADDIWKWCIERYRKLTETYRSRIGHVQSAIYLEELLKMGLEEITASDEPIESSVLIEFEQNRYTTFNSCTAQQLLRLYHNAENGGKEYPNCMIVERVKSGNFKVHVLNDKYAFASTLTARNRAYHRLEDAEMKTHE